MTKKRTESLSNEQLPTKLRVRLYLLKRAAERKRKAVTCVVCGRTLPQTTTPQEKTAHEQSCHGGTQ